MLETPLAIGATAEALEEKIALSATLTDPADAYSWVLVNDMRQDPSGFADQPANTLFVGKKTGPLA